MLAYWRPALVVVLVVGLLAGALQWWSDEPPTVSPRPTVAAGKAPPATTVPAGLATTQRPAQQVNHPSGARVDVPAGPVLYSPAVAWTELPVPAALKDVALVAPVLRFDSHSGLVFDGKVPVDLPLGGAERGTVLVWSRLGIWLPLPAQPVTLAGSKPGLRVMIDQEPTPWTFTVAKAAGDQARPASGLALREQLRWTDKAALQRETSQQTYRWPSLVPVAHAAGLEQTPDYGAWFAKANEKMHTAAWNLWDPSQNAYGHYIAGLRILRQIKGQEGREKATVALGDADWPAGLSGTVPVNTVLETMLAQYAPWGLDFTLLLNDRGMLNSRMDLRVLEPIGQLEFADVPFEAARLAADEYGRPAEGGANNPWEKELAEVAGRAGIDLNKSDQRLLLRLFSSRVMKQGWAEWTLEWTDTALRWGPVIAGLASVAAGNPAGLGLLWDSAWAVGETALDIMQEEVDAGAEAYARAQYFTTAGGDGGDIALQYSAKKGILAISDDVAQIDMNWTVTKAAISAAVAYGLVALDVGHLKEIRRITDGQPGYCEGGCASPPNVPPILLKAVLYGPAREDPGAQDFYNRQCAVSLDWKVDLGYYYEGASLHSQIERTTLEHGIEIDPSAPRLPDSQKRLAIERYRADRALPITVVDTQPSEQFVRFGLSQEVIAAALAQQKRSEKWDQVPLESLDLKVALQAFDGSESARVAALKEVTLPGDPKGVRYAAARLLRGETEPAPDAEVEPGFLGAPAGARARLRTRYQLRLLDKWDQTVALGEVDFHPKRGATTIVTRDGDKPVQALVLKDAGALEQPEQVTLDIRQTKGIFVLLSGGGGFVFMERKNPGTVERVEDPNAGIGADNMHWSEYPLRWDGNGFSVDFKAPLAGTTMPTEVKISGRISTDGQELLDLSVRTFENHGKNADGTASTEEKSFKVRVLKRVKVGAGTPAPAWPPSYSPFLGKLRDRANVLYERLGPSIGPDLHDVVWLTSPDSQWMGRRALGMKAGTEETPQALIVAFFDDLEALNKLANEQ